MNKSTSVPLHQSVLGQRDEVEEAGDASFPASDPPAYTSAAPRKKIKWTHDSDHDGAAKSSQ